MNTTKLLLVILLSGNLCALGQQNIINGSTLPTPTEYYIQVKQFGEFVDRFNYKSDWRGNLITEEFARKVSRSQYLLALLNAEDPRFSNPADSAYRKLCSEFIAFADAPNNPKTINLFGGTVKATAILNVTYCGKPQVVTAELIPEVLPDHSAKWVISKVESGCFASIADSLRANFIAPNSHETSFINIKKVNGASNPAYLFAAPMANNPTLLFMAEVAKNRMRIQTIDKVTYRIALPGWELTVEEFSRTSTNSGWLISNIRKTE